MAKENEMILRELVEFETFSRADAGKYAMKKTLLSKRVQAAKIEMDGLTKALVELKAVMR